VKRLKVKISERSEMDIFRAYYKPSEFLDIESPIAAWIIVPSSNSCFYQTLMIGFFLAVQVDLLFTPFLVLTPESIPTFDKMLWALDSFWVVSIFLQLITLRKEVASTETFDIAINYLKSEFLFDCIATFPPMLERHSRWLLILRVFHVFQL
jgi:hypothetical protein